MGVSKELTQPKVQFMYPAIALYKVEEHYISLFSMLLGYLVTYSDTRGGYFTPNWLLFTIVY